jgi:hypothetical protein
VVITGFTFNVAVLAKPLKVYILAVSLAGPTPPGDTIWAQRCFVEQDDPWPQGYRIADTWPVM